jgi:hypothetical protein
MMNSAVDDVTTPRSSRSLTRTALPGVALVLVCVFAAACSGNSTPPSVASLGASSTSTTVAGAVGTSGAPPTPRQLQALTAYAGCVRRHGLPHFPDPPYSNGELSRLGFTKAQLGAANEACHADALAAGVVPNQAAIQAHLNQMLATARCMRANGVPNFPDPDSSGQFQGESNINMNTPQYIAAAKRCGAAFGAAHGG